jgi:hypothetical protein
VLMMRKGSTKQVRSAGSNSNRRPSNASRENSVSGVAGQTTEAPRSWVSSATEYAGSASEYAEQAGQMVGEQSKRIARQTQTAFQSTVNRVLQDQPLAIAIVGLAAGAAVAAAFPTTSIEQQTLGPLGDEVTERAERFGGQLKEATLKAGEKLNSAADERGFNADGIKEVATEIAGAFSDTMSGKSNTPSGGKSVPNGGFESTGSAGPNKSYQP